MMRSSGTHTSIFLKCGLTLACLAITLVIFEFYLRETKSYIVRQNLRGETTGGLTESDPEFLIEYTPKGRRQFPNVHVIIKNHPISHRDIRIDTNSLGLRDDEIPIKKEKGELRIAALGDSITGADYLEKNETFVHKIQENLNATSSGRTIRVINCGIADVGLEEEIDLFLEQGLKLSPDIVLLEFYLNDSRPSWGFQAEIAHRGWLRRHSVIYDTIYSSLELSKWIKTTGENRFGWIRSQNNFDWKHNQSDFTQLQQLARYDWGAAWEESSWSVIERELRRLKELSVQNNFKVMIVSFPVKFQVYADFVEDAPQKKIGSLAASYGFQFLDLLPILRGHSENELFFDQCHPTVAANQIIGDAIAERLAEEIAPSPPPSNNSPP